MEDFDQRLKTAKASMAPLAYGKLCTDMHAAVLLYYKDINKPAPEGVPAFLNNAETEEILAVATLLNTEKNNLENKLDNAA